MTKLGGSLAVLALAVSALAGCTGAPETTSTIPADASPSPTASTATQSTMPSATPTPDPEPQVACGRGPNHSANGTVETDASGTPVAYVVAAGDTMWGIQNRVCLDDVAERNGINPGQIYPGDRLSLEPRADLP